MKTLLLLPLIASSLALAGDSPKPSDKPPAIPVELRAKYWRADSDNKSALLALEATREYAQQQQTQAKVMEVVGDLRKACGDNFELTLDNTPHADGTKPTGEPVCQVKPPSPPSNPKK